AETTGLGDAPAESQPEDAEVEKFPLQSIGLDQSASADVDAAMDPAPTLADPESQSTEIARVSDEAVSTSVGEVALEPAAQPASALEGEAKPAEPDLVEVWRPGRSEQ